MERSLCLLIGKDPNFDGSNYLVLTVPTNNYRALDAFIMNRFMNDKDVREFFRYQIDRFLEQNAHLLPASSNDRGDIVIIERFYNQAPVKRRVLYSDTKQKLQKVLDCSAFMRHYVDLKKDLFCGFVRDAVCKREGQDYSEPEVQKILKIWKEEIKKDPKVTDHLREMLKAYELWYPKHKEPELDKNRKNKYSIPEIQIKRLQMNRLKTKIK